MFALMLQDRGDLIREFASLDEALAGLRRLVASDAKLGAVAAVWEFEAGRPVGEPVTLAARGTSRGRKAQAA